MSGIPSDPPLRVVIVGGGVAGLEALFALRDLAEQRVELTLIAPDPDFVYKPLIVGEPFSETHAEHRALDPIARHFGARFVLQRVVGVAAGARTVELGNGERLPYDVLVACVGARQRPAYRRAITFAADGDPLALTGVLADLEGGWSKRVAFVVPPGATWSLPIYELALMTQREAWSMNMNDVALTIVTPEQAPLAIFGRTASDAVAELLAQRRIEVIPSTYAHEDENGMMVLTPGDRRLDVERIVALPVPEGPRIPGLPADERGFLPIDEHARVRGLDDVYGAGDGTTFPIKQGGIATQQADAAAEHIAARAGAPVEPRPFEPILRGMLLTGDTSLYMRQDVRGGAGEGSASTDYLWWPPHKISGRYLAPWLAHESTHADPEPPRRPLDVEVALPREWHADPMALDPYQPADRG
jgi:sulfide:quinone oxidoreductase